MGIFRKNRMEDERVTAMQNKIYRELYWLVLVICIVSIFLKFSLYGWHLERIYTELAILIGQGSYYTLRVIRLGIYSDEVELHDRKSRWPRRKKEAIIGLLGGVGLSLFFGMRSALVYGEGTTESVSYFFLVFFVSLLIYVPLLAGGIGISHILMKRASDSSAGKQLDNNGGSNEKH
ncbi:DUF6773 family protein [Virgibacillus xinjiangensis]|uniref:DUF6773 family protein n=1 Tax=Virgibacillus xinjiangensis TaxID=393090 RepID=A0ABV7CVW6_9BACI